MKKLIFALVLFAVSFSAFSQTGNDTTKYIWYKYTYGNRIARLWGDSVLMGPRDTVYSKWGFALIGSTFYHGDGTRWYAGVNAGGAATNIYTSDGTLSAGTRTLTFNNNLLQFYSASGASAEFDINLNNGSTGTYFARGPGTATQYTATATTQNGFNERGTYAEIFGINTSSGHSNKIRTYGDSTSFNSDNGFYRFQNTPASADTSAIKPAGLDATGKLARLNYWPGSGGTVHFIMKGNSGDSLIWVNAPDSLFTRLYRDSLNFHHIVNTDGSVTFYSSFTTSNVSTGTDVLLSYSAGNLQLATPDASATARGVINTGSQTIAGVKTFNAAPVLTTSSTTGYVWTATDGSGHGGWAASAGGGIGLDSAYTTITTGGTYTISDDKNVVWINPSSGPITVTVNLPTNWHTSNLVKFKLGGAITSGNPVVILTVNAGSGQTMVWSVPVSGATYNAGESLQFSKISGQVYNFRDQ